MKIREPQKGSLDSYFLDSDLGPGIKIACDKACFQYLRKSS